MLSDLWDLIKCVFWPVFLLILAFVIFFAALVAPISAVTCAEKGKAMQMETQFSLWTDCMIKTQQGWVPLDRYIVNAEVEK